MVSGTGLARGQLWWADLDEPAGSEPGCRRPVLIVQADAFNRSVLRTVVVAGLTTNLKLGRAPGNVVVPAGVSGLARDSVVNVSQLGTLDRSFLTDFVGVLPSGLLREVGRGLRLILAL